jgi:cation-transporting ATPase 13A3/4/5
VPLFTTSIFSVIHLGIWVILLAFGLSLARAAKALSPSHHTASILGPNTLSSVVGVLALNFLFPCFAWIALFHQDWYQCRKWGSTDVSNVVVIADNYEAETIFLVTGYQYISSAMTFNFGYTHRAAWITNYVFVSLALGFTIIHVYITLVPGKLSCLFRVNCINEDVVRLVTSLDVLPIQNPLNTTVMPVNIRWILVVIMVLNTICIMGYDYFFVNGIFKKLGKEWE